MTREEAGKLAIIAKAYADGKEIEFYNDEYKIWASINDPSFDDCVDYYRVKQEPKYRPFANSKECFEEMKKHEPVGWVQTKAGQHYSQVVRIVQNQLVCFGPDVSTRSFQYVFENYTFADGIPFGVKEEETTHGA